MDENGSECELAVACKKKDAFKWTKFTIREKSVVSPMLWFWLNITSWKEDDETMHGWIVHNKIYLQNR